MEEIHIYHHLGLGDHIVCNSIVRNYAKFYKQVFLFVKPHNYENIKFMYRDLENINFLIGDDEFANSYIQKNNINLTKIGFEKMDIRYCNFDESFYQCVGLDFQKMWSDFHIERDSDKELEIFKSLGIEEGKYIFVHDLNGECKSKISSDMKIISGSKIDCGLFDLCYTIENANEIHLMESSIKCLIDHLDLKTNKLFYHRYIRNYPQHIEATSKLKWITYQ